jgi:hypothetical protein
MNLVLRIRFTMPAAVLLLSMLAAGQADKSRPEPTLSPDNLRNAAHQTYANYNRAFQAGEEKVQEGLAEVEIPSKYWDDPIKALKPLRVYIHRINIVVVQRIQNGIEEGKYILIPVSSYLPHNGVDGFDFTPNPQRGNLYYSGDGVLEFRRTRGK